MKKIILTMLFAVFLLCSFTVPSFSQMTVGVSVDDTFRYEGVVTDFTTSDPSLEISMWMSFNLYFNETDYENRTVTDVTGTNITFAIATQYSNGTLDESELVENITSSYWYRAIGAGMEAGDEIRAASGFSGAITINETIMVDYGGTEGERETNVVYVNSDWTFAGVTKTTTYYWDKDTGILVKQVENAYYSGTDGDMHLVLEIQMTNTNVWVIPEFPTGTVMLLTFAAVAVSVEIIRRKKLKK
jgi:hypothetical protein